MAEQKNATNTSALTLMGVLLILFGVLAIATPAVAGAAVIMVVGGVLLIAGIIQVVSGLRSEGWSNKLPPLILGLLASLSGLGLLGEHWIGMQFISLILATFFIVEGIYKIYASFGYRPASGWLFLLASGVVALVLGLMIWKQSPFSGLWAVGILVGVDLLVTGIAMVALASTIRRLRKEAISQEQGQNTSSESASNP